jgi:hypothetical protein
MAAAGYGVRPGGGGVLAGGLMQQQGDMRGMQAQQQQQQPDMRSMQPNMPGAIIQQQQQFMPQGPQVGMPISRDYFVV